MAELTPNQRKVLRELKAAPSYRRASAKARLALIEAALVESNLSTPNQANSDRDSEGALQQRPSQGWGPTSETNTQDAEQFLRRAIPLAKKYGSAGQLAQAVQRSAYPGRYDQRRSLAMKLMGGGGGGGGGTPANASLGAIPAGRAASAGTTTETVGDPDAMKRVILARYLTRNNPNSLLLRLGVVSPNEATTHEASVPLPPQQQPAQGRGGKNNVTPSQGKLGGKLHELFYDPIGGIDEGKEIGAIGGHKDHVHAAFSSPLVAVRAGKLAQRMGLHVGEQSHFDHVDPVHTKGSFHYKDEAIDVSGSPQKMAAFYKVVKRMYGVA